MLEYFRHVLKLLERHKPELHGADLGEIFRFKVEDRLECNSSHQVKIIIFNHTIIIPFPFFVYVLFLCADLCVCC